MRGFALSAACIALASSFLTPAPLLALSHQPAVAPDAPLTLPIQLKTYKDTYVAGDKLRAATACKMIRSFPGDKSLMTISCPSKEAMASTFVIDPALDHKCPPEDDGRICTIPEP